MKIGKNKMVSLTYDLHYDDADGELIEQATSEKPLSFVFGAGLMLPKFESHLDRKAGRLFRGVPHHIACCNHLVFKDLQKRDLLYFSPCGGAA